MTGQVGETGWVAVPERAQGVCQREGRSWSPGLFGERQGPWRPWRWLGSVDGTACEPEVFLLGCTCRSHGLGSFFKMPVLGPHPRPGRESQEFF